MHHRAVTSTIHSDYTRSCGRQLTYRISVDGRGGFTVWLQDKVLLRGHDPLAAGGRSHGPNKRRAAGALQQARGEIESLSLMSEV